MACSTPFCPATGSNPMQLPAETICFLRYSNILNINRYHGVFSYEKNGATHYKVFIHINGNYKIGSYASEASAAVAYNKAADLAKTFGVTKQFPENYVDTLNPREYAELYTHVKISKKYIDYLKTFA